MTLTFINGTYSLNAETEDAKELLKELSLAIKMLSEDLTEANESSSKKIIDDLILDLTADSVYHLSNVRC